MSTTQLHKTTEFASLVMMVMVMMVRSMVVMVMTIIAMVEANESHLMRWKPRVLARVTSLKDNEINKQLLKNANVDQEYVKNMRPSKKGMTIVMRNVHWVKKTIIASGPCVA